MVNRQVRNEGVQKPGFKVVYRNIKTDDTRVSDVVDCLTGANLTHLAKSCTSHRKEKGKEKEKKFKKEPVAQSAPVKPHPKTPYMHSAKNEKNSRVGVVPHIVTLDRYFECIV